MMTELPFELAGVLDLTVIETPPELEDPLLGFHESAHTVVAVILGVPIEDVMISRRHGGLTSLAANPRGINDVLVSLAGPVAETLWLAGNGIAHDVLVVGCEDDLRDAWGSTPGAGASQLARFIELHGMTEQLVSQHWLAVLDLAGHLIERRCIPAADVYRILGA